MNKIIFNAYVNQYLLNDFYALVFRLTLENENLLYYF